MQQTFGTYNQEGSGNYGTTRQQRKASRLVRLAGSEVNTQTFMALSGETTSKWYLQTHPKRSHAQMEHVRYINRSLNTSRPFHRTGKAVLVDKI